MTQTKPILSTSSSISVQHSALFESFQKYRWLLFLTVFFSLLAAVFEIFSIGLLIPFLRSLSRNPEQGFGTGVYLIDHWVLAVNAPKLNDFTAFVALFSSARGFARSCPTLLPFME